MSRRARTGRDPFGLSLLDMLCCSFGSVILLIVLNQQTADERLDVARAVADAAVETWKQAYAIWKPADDQRAKAKADLQSANRRIDEARGRVALYQGILAGLPGGPAPPVPSTEFRPAAAGKRAVVLVDCSGSMDRHDRSEVLPADGECPPKWRTAMESVERFLLEQKDLESFAVIAIDDGRLRPLSESRIHPRQARWATGRGEAGLAEIGEASRAIFERRPAGGAAHGWTLDAVRKEYVRGAADDADVILILTDGLPNRGMGTAERGGPARQVTVDEKRAFAEEALRVVGQSPSGRSLPPCHVICLEWPDDTELANFALAIAGKTGGFVAYLGPPREPAP